MAGRNQDTRASSGNFVSREQLVLRSAATIRRTNALFKAMASDHLLREQFITDPAQVLSEYLEGEKLPAQVASVSNQLLYSILSNRKLMQWLQNYAVRNRGRAPSRQAFMNDFGRAVVEQGGEHVVYSLIRSTISQENPLNIGGPEVAFFITSSPLIASGFLLSTDQRTINDSNSTQSFEHSSDTMGTGPGTWHGTENPPHTDHGTTTGTGTDTGTSTSTDTGTSTDSDSNAATAVDTGTEGTDPGTGETEDGLINFASGIARETLEALVLYAVELKNLGALNVAIEEQQAFRG